jgi:hypothetical protein
VDVYHTKSVHASNPIKTILSYQSVLSDYILNRNPDLYPHKIPSTIDVFFSTQCLSTCDIFFSQDGVNGAAANNADASAADFGRVGNPPAAQVSRIQGFLQE